MPSLATQTSGAASTAVLLDRSSSLVETAKRELRQGPGATPPDRLLALGEQLKNAGLFDFACRILARARQQRTSDDRLRHRLTQQLALCTYKNPDAPLVDRLDEALRILEEDIDLRTTEDQESLGLAGAIFKRKWQADGDKEHLETSYEYCRRGFDQGVEHDWGYTAINAACVLDLLGEIEARQAARTGASRSAAPERTAEAKSIRTAIVEALLARRQLDTAAFDASWWPVATLAEAYFGLQDFESAAHWLRTARTIKGVPRWQVDSTAQQLATLARLQCKAQIARHTGPARLDPLVDPETSADSPGWTVVREFLDVPSSVIRSAALGKVGLALSGVASAPRCSTLASSRRWPNTICSDTSR